MPRPRVRGPVRAGLVAGAGLLTAALLVAVPSGTAPTGAGSAYAAPTARTWHVSVHGRDAASGQAGSPVRHLRTAVKRARAGDRVVVHAGVYHESVTIPAGKRLAIRTADGSAWLDGTRRVRGWHRTAHGWATRWTVEFDHSPTYTWGARDGTEPGWTFVNPARPMAAHPDQVWLDGHRLRQVPHRRQLRPGTFYVAEEADRLVLGTDPRGRVVRASDLAKALSIRAAGTTVRGLGVRRFAPSVPHMGAVTAEAPRVTLTGMRILQNATTGLHVSAAGAVVRGVELRGNGMLGLSATYADGLRVVRTVARHNNTERFNTAPVAGGAKIGRSRDVAVRHSRFLGNRGTGLWFDESAYNIRVVDSVLRRNLRHGLALELSTRALVVDTLVAGNRGHGIKINNTARVELWNNTVVRNGRPVNIVQDDRDVTDLETPGHDPRRPRPDPTMDWTSRAVVVHNNVLGRSRGDANCLLCVEDYSGRWSAEQFRIRANGNVYQRPRAAAPRWAVVWSNGAGDPDVFTSVRSFRAATGREARHLDLVGRRAVTSSLRLAPGVSKRIPAVAVRLAARPAQAAGRRAGIRHLGVWR